MEMVGRRDDKPAEFAVEHGAFQAGGHRHQGFSDAALPMSVTNLMRSSSSASKA